MRTTGKTTRAVLDAALSLSKGRQLVLIKEEFDESQSRYFALQLAELVRYLGFFDAGHADAFQCVGGGRFMRTSRNNLHGHRNLERIESV